jgi:hypothetical protein
MFGLRAGRSGSEEDNLYRMAGLPLGDWYEPDCDQPAAGGSQQVVLLKLTCHLMPAQKVSSRTESLHSGK